MKFNIISNELARTYFADFKGENHTQYPVYVSTVETAGNSLYECLMNAVVFLVDESGNNAGSVYASELSDSLYDQVEALIASEVNGSDMEAV